MNDVLELRLKIEQALSEENYLKNCTVRFSKNFKTIIISQINRERLRVISSLTSGVTLGTDNDFQEEQVNSLLISLNIKEDSLKKLGKKLYNLILDNRNEKFMKDGGHQSCCFVYKKIHN
jgi:hypothetical protein